MECLLRDRYSARCKGQSTEQKTRLSSGGSVSDFFNKSVLWKISDSIICLTKTKQDFYKKLPEIHHTRNSFITSFIRSKENDHRMAQSILPDVTDMVRFINQCIFVRQAVTTKISGTTQMFALYLWQST